MPVKPSPRPGLRAALVRFALAVGLLLAIPTAQAQQNPLLGGSAGESPDAASDSPTMAPSPFHRLEAFLIQTQRDVNREINRRLIAIRDGRGAGVILAGILIALLYGVFHALGPGHGKTVIVGYFIGRGGSIGRGVAMASWIALSHVVGAILIVGALHYILTFSLVTPVEETLWLRLISYGAILVIGLAMLAGAIRRQGGVLADACRHHGHGPEAADHTHDHGHGHGLREQRLLALAAGFLPCSGAILILVFAFANGILLAGLLMTLAIALGMGATLALLGIASVLAHRQLAGHFAGGGRLGNALAYLGPLLITGIGAILLAGALLERGSQ